MFRALLTFFGFLIILAFVGVGGVIYVFNKFGQDLPDYRQLANYEPPVMTRVHAGDGRLLAEYAIEKRVFVPIQAMPKRVVNAFLSAEDHNFYNHQGIDFVGVTRAIIINLKNLGKQRRMVGASTITQQVAKNFLLTNEVSWDRKVKEAILAFRIERAFTKDRILELYLNEIYLGYGSYGVAAAALNYFNKPLDQLTIEEVAYLAALPKAPNNYHPVRSHDAAVIRRDWVIGRMLEDGVITDDEAMIAKSMPLATQQRSDTEFVTAEFFAEEVRRELAERYGEKELYKGGLSVRTTLNPKFQDIADKALRDGLQAYDRRHGWRGPLMHLEVDDSGMTIHQKLVAIEPIPGLRNWKMAVVLDLDDKAASIGLADGKTGHIPLEQLKWARPWAKDEKLGPRVNRPSDVLGKGDVIVVESLLADKEGNLFPAGTHALRQIPEIEGALVALDPHTGRVLAMSGGYDYTKSQFNRVTQAKRQPGSAFKPFVYLAALESGYSPSTLILDAPFVIDQGPGLPKWRPANYTKKFYGPSTMRLGIEKSRNLMTVRLAQTVGMDKISEYANRFGLIDNMPEQLAMSLGAGETTLLRLTAGYAMLVNGGKKITPTLIDRIQDRHGRKVFSHDLRTCNDCQASFWTNQPVPLLPDLRQQLSDPASAYQIVSMLKGVVDRGTGRSIRSVGKPLGGKTGTTNNSVDAWFIGFSPDLAVGVFTGFDEPRSLGKSEQGASVAAPIFRQFMQDALADSTATPFRIPPGIRLVRVNATTGSPARAGEKRIILEAFKPGSVPSGESQVLRGLTSNGGAPASGTGGLY
ncbi:MAG: penicillin-binding protein 1A [Rhodospirillales bacterium]|nr:penicillin-binding protein 1A [Rhodospirillales bacterium]